jgi:hypothetical protein
MVPQRAEHQTNYQDPAQQLESSPNEPRRFSKHLLTELQQDIPSSNAKEFHNTEEGEISQPSFTSPSRTYNSTAVNIIASPIITPSTTSSTKGTTDDPTYSPSNITQYNHLQPYHAKNNAHNNEPHLLSPNLYHSKDTQIYISPNALTNSPSYRDQSPTATSTSTANNYNEPNHIQLQTHMTISQSHILQLSSTTDVDQQCAGKQPCHSLEETTPNTAPTQTTQARMQPCLSGIPTISNTAQLAGPSTTINVDPFLTRRGMVPTYTTNNPFMFFNQHTVNVILQHPTMDDQPYYQAALAAHKAITNLSTATISVYPQTAQGPSVAIWTLHENTKQLKAVESVAHNHPGNTLTHTHDTHSTHPHTQMSMPHQPHHTNTQTPHTSHTNTQDYIPEAQYKLRIELHGIAKLHLHLLDTLLLRTLQHTLTPLVTHTVFGPPQ